MNILVKNKGVLIFYMILIIFIFLCSWRFERLEENGDQTNEPIVLYVK